MRFECLHAFFTTARNRGPQLVRGAIANETSNRFARYHNFCCRAKSTLIGERNETQANECAERVCESYPCVLLLARWEKPDNSIDRLRRLRRRVQCGEDDVTGFRGLQTCRHRFDAS